MYSAICSLNNLLITEVQAEGLLLLEPVVASSRHVSFPRAARGPTAQLAS